MSREQARQDSYFERLPQSADGVRIKADIRADDRHSVDKGLAGSCKSALAVALRRLGSSTPQISAWEPPGASLHVLLEIMERRVKVRSHEQHSPLQCAQSPRRPLQLLLDEQPGD